MNVEEGSVKLTVKDKKGSTDVAAGKAFTVAADGSVQPMDDGARAQMFAWVRDTLSFTDTPVKVVLPELIRWFALNASLADPSLGERKVSLVIGMQSSGDAIKMLAEAANLSIGFDKDDKVVLSDAGTAPAKGAKKK